MHRLFKLMIFLGVVLLASNAWAISQEPIYLFPIQIKTEHVNEQERGWIQDVYQEEMAALFWLKPIGPHNAASVLGQATAGKLAACKTPKAALPALRQANVSRMVVLSITRPKRHQFIIEAAVLDRRGKPQYSTRYVEHGGAGEIKYVISSVLEQLFEKEIQANATRITSIVETSAVTSNEADRLIDSAEEQVAAGDLQAAVDLFQQAATMSTELALPWRRKAQLLATQEQYDEAIACAEQAVKRDASDVEARLVWGQSLFALGRVKQAKKQIEAALSLDSNSVRGQFLYGMVLDGLGKHKQAAKAFTKAVTLAPDSSEIRINLGKMYLKLQRYQPAIEQLQQVIDSNPELLAAYAPLAEAYEAAKNWEKAAQLYEILGEKVPECAACLFNLARMEEQMKQFESAIAHYQDCLDYDPAFIDAYFNLGSVSLRNGDRESGVANLKEYIQREHRSDQKEFVKLAKKMISENGGR